MTYLISVIIPVFNVEKYIKQALESIVSQTIGIDNIEVIIVNDCTPDNSMDIVNSYASKYSSIKVINHDTNKGLGEARNTALNYVSSDYVTFLDSDDFISPNAFLNSINKIKESNADLLIYNWDFYTVGYIEPPSIHQPNFKKDEIISNLKEKPNLIFLTASWNKIYHKSLFKYLNFPLGLYEDNIVSCEVLINASRIYLNHEATYFYRRNQLSITENISIKNVFDLSSLISNLFDLTKKYPFYKEIINQLAIKFIHDILFWIYNYEWSINDEIAMISKLQESITDIKEDELDLYKSLIYNHFPFFRDDILNLCNYESSDFLAIYKYYNHNPKLKAVASLYIDLGSGFCEENKLSIEYQPVKINKLSFNLEKFDNIKSLRFDPIEGEFSKVKLYNDLDIISCNLENSLDDEFHYFTTLDPFYIINFNNNEFQIEFKLDFLNNEELANFFNKKLAIINSLTQNKNEVKSKRNLFNFLK